MSTFVNVELLPALFAANIPAVLALFSYLLHSRDEADQAPQTFEPYRRKQKLVHVIETLAQWESFWEKVASEVETTKAVGFDCEWVSAVASKKREVEVKEVEVAEDRKDDDDDDDNGDEIEAESRNQKPTSQKVDGRVSLIQIATPGGDCGLVRILLLECVPETLKTMLENKNVLKLGVSPMDDGNRLRKDFG